MTGGEFTEKEAWQQERDELLRISEVWLLIPTKPNSKAPLIQWGHLRNPDPQLVRDYWDPTLNWSVVCGPPSSGLITVDVDRYEAQYWIDQQGGFVRCPTIWHPTRRGFHYYFELLRDLLNALPASVELAPSVEVLVHHHLALIPRLWSRRSSMYGESLPGRASAAGGIAASYPTKASGHLPCHRRGFWPFLRTTLVAVTAGIPSQKSHLNAIKRCWT